MAARRSLNEGMARQPGDRSDSAGGIDLERSLAEFEAMLTHAGFAISDTSTVPLRMSVIEAIPA